MKISYKSSFLIAFAVMLVSGGSVFAVNVLDFSNKANTWAQTNCTEKQLSQKKPNITDAVCNNSQLTATNTAELTQQKNQIQTLSTQQSTSDTELTQQQDKIQELTTQLANYQKAPPVDFAFFTNYAFTYNSANVFMSPVFDANDYTKFSLTFTCTSHTNDEVKYWIETSADGVNWSPWGYYHARCNGVYSGASLNIGPTTARYFALAVQSITPNTNTNTITSIARFSN